MADVLSRRAAQGSAREPSEVDERRALALVAAAAVAGKVPAHIDRKIAHTLINLYDRQQTRERRYALVNLVMLADSVAWRRLWMLWENAVEYDTREDIAEKLGERLAFSAATRPNFAERRLPGWLSRSPSAIAKVLQAPGPAVRQYVEAQGIVLSDFSSTCELNPASRIGSEVVVELIRKGSPSWWASMSPAAVRAWAGERAFSVVAAVADRQLCDVGGEHETPAAISNDQALASWVTGLLQDPAKNDARWQKYGLSERARQIYEWLVLTAEVGKILAEFRKHAEVDRADFWARQIPYIVDARYYSGSQAAVCMMVIGEVVVIEFGTTGNACYFYDAPPRPLRSLSLPDRMAVSKFKRKDGLDLGGVRLTYRNKLSHVSGWTANYSDYLYGPIWRRR